MNKEFLLNFCLICWGPCGIISLILGKIFSILDKKKEKICTVHAWAVVKDIVNHPIKDKYGKIDRWFPVLEYKVGEDLITQEYYGDVKESDYKIGEQIEIYYNMQNNREYYIASDISDKKVVKFFYCIGIIALLLTVITLIIKFV